MGQAPPGESYNSANHGVPLIAGAGDFSDGRVVTKKYTTAPSKVSMPGDIILSIRASIGDKVTGDEDYCLGRGVAAIRPQPGVITRYLWHWLTSIETELVGKGKGATFKQVNRSDIGELPIAVPSLGEQRQVAAILDQADELRAKRRQAIVLLDDLAESTFLDMFNSHYSEATINLGDHLTFITSGGRGWATYYSDAGSRFIRSLDVRMNEISHKDAAYVTPPNNAEAKRTKVKSGDVLLTITGSLIWYASGTFPLSPSNLEGSYISQHVAILRPDATMLDPGFLAFFLSLPDGGQRQISQLQYGQTKPGLNFEQIRGYENSASSYRIAAVVPREAEDDQKHRRLTPGTTRHTRCTLRIPTGEGVPQRVVRDLPHLSG